MFQTLETARMKIQKFSWKTQLLSVYLIPLLCQFRLCLDGKKTLFQFSFWKLSLFQTTFYFSLITVTFRIIIEWICVMYENETSFTFTLPIHKLVCTSYQVGLASLEKTLNNFYKKRILKNTGIWFIYFIIFYHFI